MRANTNWSYQAKLGVVSQWFTLETTTAASNKQVDGVNADGRERQLQGLDPREEGRLDRSRPDDIETPVSILKAPLPKAALPLATVRCPHYTSRCHGHRAFAFPKLRAVRRGWLCR